RRLDDGVGRPLLEAEDAPAVPEGLRGVPVGEAARAEVGEVEAEPDPELTPEIRPAARQYAPSCCDDCSHRKSLDTPWLPKPWDFQSIYRILDRNCFVLSCSGAWKKCSGVPSSMMTPSSIITTRSAASRAKPISWVTTIIVMPSWASSSMTDSTSPVTSGSSA